jgi:hypothetical protein
VYQDFSQHPLLIQRLGKDPSLDTVLQELAVLGDIELRLTTLDEHMSVPYYWMTLHLKTSGQQLVQEVCQPGKTPKEAAIRCLVGGLQELQLHSQKGVEDIVSFLDFPH